MSFADAVRFLRRCGANELLCLELVLNQRRLLRSQRKISAFCQML